MDNTGAGTDQEAELLRSFLAVREARCPWCRYSLRGLAGSACPECGRALRLAVGGGPGRTRLVRLALIGMTLGGGLDGFGCVNMARTISSWPSSAGGPLPWWFWGYALADGVGALGALAGVGLWVWMRLRGRSTADRVAIWFVLWWIAVRSGLWLVLVVILAMR
jgi:hypothetical protein